MNHKLTTHLEVTSRRTKDERQKETFRLSEAIDQLILAAKSVLQTAPIMMIIQHTSDYNHHLYHYLTIFKVYHQSSTLSKVAYHNSHQTEDQGKCSSLILTNASTMSYLITLPPPNK